jgi:hypothetical protein
MDKMKYTYETHMSANKWQRNKMAYDSIDAVATALTEWLIVCAINDFFPEVRIIELEN